MASTTLPGSPEAEYVEMKVFTSAAQYDATGGETDANQTDGSIHSATEGDVWTEIRLDMSVEEDTDLEKKDEHDPSPKQVTDGSPNRGPIRLGIYILNLALVVVGLLILYFLYAYAVGVAKNLLPVKIEQPQDLMLEYELLRPPRSNNQTELKQIEQVYHSYPTVNTTKNWPYKVPTWARGTKKAYGLIPDMNEEGESINQCSPDVPVIELYKVCRICQERNVREGHLLGSYMGSPNFDVIRPCFAFCFRTPFFKYCREVIEIPQGQPIPKFVPPPEN